MINWADPWMWVFIGMFTSLFTLFAWIEMKKAWKFEDDTKQKSKNNYMEQTTTKNRVIIVSDEVAALIEPHQKEIDAARAAIRTASHHLAEAEKQMWGVIWENYPEIDPEKMAYCHAKKELRLGYSDEELKATFSRIQSNSHARLRRQMRESLDKFSEKVDKEDDEKKEDTKL